MLHPVSFSGRVTVAGIFLLLAALSSLAAQGPNAKKEPDVLILNNGEKLIGELESSTPKTVTFKSESMGEITLAWTKVKELHSSQPFAVIPKDLKLNDEEEAKTVPQGTVTVADKNIGEPEQQSGRTPP